MLKPTRCCLAFFLVTLIAVCPLAAETHIQLFNLPLDELVRPRQPTPIDPSAPSATKVVAGSKTERPSTLLIMGHFKIDSTNPFGETTFVTVRNEGDSPEDLELLLFPVDSLGFQDIVDLGTVQPRQVVPINLAVHATSAPGADGFIRGWARIGTSRPVSADFFQVNTSQDFAAAGALIDIDADEFCYMTRSRFLIGGGFSGGTEITLMQDQRLGGEIGVDPPSIEGEVFDEAGVFVNSFAITTDNFSLQLQAEDLVLPGTTAGAIEFVFKNALDGFLGGFSSSELKANDKFSVSLKGTCLQQNPDTMGL